MEWSAKDGDCVPAGQQLGKVSGLASSILVAERVALNFMQVGAKRRGQKGQQGGVLVQTSLGIIINICAERWKVESRAVAGTVFAAFEHLNLQAFTLILSLL